MIDGLVARGVWTEAAERSRSLSRRLPPGYWQFFGFTTLWPDLGAYAETHEVAQYLSDALTGAAARQSLLDQVAAVVALAIWEGRPAEAGPIADPILGQTPEAFVRWHGGELYWRLLWAAADIGATDDAARWLRDIEALLATPSEESGHVSPYAAAFGSLCRAEHRRASLADQPADWMAAVGDVDGFGLTFPGAYARFRLAEAIVRAGEDRAQAAAVLHDARQTAVALGAKPLLAQIDLLARRARLSVAGDDPADDRDPDPVAHGLSPRELEVLRQVAAGASNRQIGEALFISTKTASVHVSNILAKLQVASRGEAAAVAHRLGLA
jgi:DNA-binding CsgD family transcriptional regulator